MLEGMLPTDEALHQSGQYGPRVHIPDDADVQTKLLAFIGRTPIDASVAVEIGGPTPRRGEDDITYRRLGIQCSGRPAFSLLVRLAE